MSRCLSLPHSILTTWARVGLPCLLLCACAPLTVARLPDTSVIGMADGALMAPDCRAMQQPSEMPMRDGLLQLTPRPSVAFGCATYSNLAKMLVNPQDLVQPQPYPGQSATTAGAAVQRYYDDKVKALHDSATTDVKSGNSSSSGSTGSSGSSGGSSQ